MSEPMPEPSQDFQSSRESLPAMVDAYDTRTGLKLPNQVPASWLKDGRHEYLSKTPKAAAADTTNPKVN